MNQQKFYSPFDKEKRRLGDIMLSSYYLSEDEVEEIIEDQKINPGTRFGYRCIEKGFADPLEVMDALLRQLPVTVPYSASKP